MRGESSESGGAPLHSKTAKLCKETQIVTTNPQNQKILCQPCQPKQLIVRNRKCLMRRISWICQSRLFRKPKIVNCSKARKRLSPAPAPALADPSLSRV